MNRSVIGEGPSTHRNIRFGIIKLDGTAIGGACRIERRSRIDRERIRRGGAIKTARGVGPRLGIVDGTVNLNERRAEGLRLRPLGRSGQKEGGAGCLNCAKKRLARKSIVFKLFRLVTHPTCFPAVFSDRDLPQKL
jgi:hypothetical protein